MTRVRIQSAAIFCFAILLGILCSVGYRRLKGVSKDVVRWTVDKPHEEKYKEYMLSRQLLQTYNDQEENLTVEKESKYLKENVKVLCLIFMRKSTADKYSASSAPQKTSAYTAIKNTWASKCKKVLYLSHYKLEGRSWVQLKSRNLEEWNAYAEALTFLFRSDYLSKFDWFLFAEQDTFVIMDNLRYYLSVYNPSQPYYFGHAFDAWQASYNAAGPGFVLSHAAMKKLQSTILKGHCKANSNYADVELGTCLEDVGVFVSDTRDSQGRGRFLVFQPEFLLIPGKLPWSEKYWSNSKYTTQEGPNCCSDYAISFHYVPPNMMYVYYFLVYTLQPYGILPPLTSPLHNVSTIATSYLQTTVMQSVQPTDNIPLLHLLPHSDTKTTKPAMLRVQTYALTTLNSRNSSVKTSANMNMGIIDSEKVPTNPGKHKRKDS